MAFIAFSFQYFMNGDRLEDNFISSPVICFPLAKRCFHLLLSFFPFRIQNPKIKKNKKIEQ